MLVLQLTAPLSFEVDAMDNDAYVAKVADMVVPVLAIDVDARLMEFAFMAVVVVNFAMYVASFDPIVMLIYCESGDCIAVVGFILER